MENEANRSNVQSPDEQKKESKLGSIIVNVFLVLCIVFAIFCTYTAYVSKAGNGVPSLFGLEPFAVQTDSMAPFFEAGDLVIDTKVKSYSDLKVGDVITFWTIINGQKVLNTHRIVGITGDAETYFWFETKGDANDVADTTGVHQADIVGVYKTHIKNVGSLLDFLQTGKGFLICLVVPMAIFFVYELITFMKTLSAYRAEKVRLEVQEAREKAQAETQAAVAAALKAAGITGQVPVPGADTQTETPKTDTTEE